MNSGFDGTSWLRSLSTAAACIKRGNNTEISHTWQFLVLALATLSSLPKTTFTLQVKDLRCCRGASSPVGSGCLSRQRRAGTGGSLGKRLTVKAGVGGGWGEAWIGSSPSSKRSAGR